MLKLEDDGTTGDNIMAKKKAANETVVASYAQRLNEAGKDRARFDAVMKDMKSDQQVGVAEATMIAASYAKKRFATKVAAIEGVAKRFVDNVRTDARMEIAVKERIM